MTRLNAFSEDFLSLLFFILITTLFLEIITVVLHFLS